MSVIMRNICGGSNGGSSKGFPPGDATNISVRSGSRCAKIKWSDPDNTVENGTTLSTWSSTIIVRKEGSAPSSIKDGTIIITNTTKNKYKDTPYIDSNVTVGKTYYYRFFTVSTDKVYNTDSNMIYSIIIVQFGSILKDNSWEAIAAASEEGSASDIWKVGDEIDITLSGTFNETVTLQIWDFNHFDKSDGSGKAGICFGMKNLMKECEKMNNSDTSTGGWNDTYMRNTVMQNILKSMPSNLRNAIKEVNTYANAGNHSTSSSIGKLSKDKVFLPGFAELVSNDWTSQDQCTTETNQKKFPIFTDNNSRIKKLSNGKGSAYDWWTRSPAYSDSCYGFCGIGSPGYSTSNNPSSDSSGYGVCFCFNV